MSADLVQTTAMYLSAFPPLDGKGKWHAAVKVTGTSYCGSSRSMVLLDVTAAPIIATAESAHPFVCKRCLAMWKADHR